MIVATTPDRLPRLSRTARLLLWAPLLLLTGIPCLLKARHEAETRRVLQKYRDELPTLNAASEDALNRVKALYRSRRHPAPGFTRADVERELNGGQPLKPSGRPGWYLWTDAASGRQFELSIQRGRASDREPTWGGFGSGWSNASNPPPVPAPRLLTAIEPVRRALAYKHGGWGPGVWAVGLVAYCAARRWRAVAGELLLAVSMLTVAALLLSPYPLSLRGVTSNDPLAWGVPMCLATALLFRHALAVRVRPPAGLCTSCGYDLRATPGRCPECGAVPTTPASGAPA